MTQEGLVIYPEIKDDVFRLSLLVGEMILAVAISEGLVPVNNKINDWPLLSAETVVNGLRPTNNSDQTIRLVLKNVRSQLQNSKLNGNRRQAFDMISNLMRTLGKPKGTSELPPIPQRSVAKFS